MNETIIHSALCHHIQYASFVCQIVCDLKRIRECQSRPHNKSLLMNCFFEKASNARHLFPPIPPIVFFTHANVIMNYWHLCACTNLMWAELFRKNIQYHVKNQSHNFERRTSQPIRQTKESHWTCGNVCAICGLTNQPAHFLWNNEWLLKYNKIYWKINKFISFICQNAACALHSMPLIWQVIKALCLAAWWIATFVPLIDRNTNPVCRLINNDKSSHLNYSKTSNRVRSNDSFWDCAPSHPHLPSLYRRSINIQMVSFFLLLNFCQM